MINTGCQFHDGCEFPLYESVPNFRLVNHTWIICSEHVAQIKKYEELTARLQEKDRRAQDAFDSGRDRTLSADAHISWWLSGN